MKDLKRRLVENVKNIPGWRTNRKIVVFISDDWGDKRVRSDEDYQKLIEHGVPLDQSEMATYDTIASSEDLSRLFEVLTSVKDKNNRSAVLTPFTIMSNPNFEKIAGTDFQEYFYRDFTETMNREPDGSKIIDAWNEGIREKVFSPEYHGRDHLNVPMWLEALKSGNEIVHFAFNHHYAHIKTSDMKVSPAVAFYFNSKESFRFLNDSLVDGIKLFRDIFERNPEVFNPPNGMFHTSFYRSLAEMNVYNIGTKHFREQPTSTGDIEKKYFKFGQISKEGIIHFISNGAFEPTKATYKDTADVMRQIEAAFRWNKPALINTHRVNYVSGRSVIKRDKGLKELSELLKEIEKRWPAIEFMSAGEFIQCLNKSVLSKVSNE